MYIAAENLLRVLDGQEPEWIPVECLADRRYGEGAYIFVTYAGALVPPQGGLDLWGVGWTPTGEALPYPNHHPAGSLVQALHLPPPCVDTIGLWDQAQAQADIARGRTLIIGRQVCALFERFWSLTGMERALVSLISEPDLAASLLDRIADWQIAVADRFIRIGVDAARVSDDYGAQNDLLLSPSLWRQMIQPRLARLVAHYKASGVPVILHSCGNLARIMDDLIDLGFVAFNIQASANDLPAMKKRYGRSLCIWGGISTQATSSAEPDQVRIAVRRAITELGYDGRLVLEPDQVIHIPEENLIAFSQSAQQYKRLFRPSRSDNRYPGAVLMN